MANPYTQVSITGYNANPPDDDGSETEANRVRWATIKTKITDPVKTRTDTMDTNIASAFGKIDGGVTVYSTSSSVAGADQGKLVRATASGITITTPDATSVGAPFVFDFSNGSTGDVTLEGYDTQTIDGEDSIVVSAGAGLRVRTDGTNWFTTGRNFQRTRVTPQGYLTLLSVASSPTSPLPSADQASKTSVYYRPDGGDLVPIPDGTVFNVRSFSELTLTLNSNHVANGIYDVFLFDDSGTITIGTGPVWNTVTAGSGVRGTGAGTTELDVLNGLFINKVSMTARNGSTTYTVAAKCGLYVGSLYIDGTAGQVTCHVSYGQSRKWGVWNVYNRRRAMLQAGPSTASWIAPAPSTIRAANADSNNKLTTLCGLPEEVVEITSMRKALIQTSAGTGESVSLSTGIGVNATNAYTGVPAIFSLTGATGGASDISQTEVLVTSTRLLPGIGINDVSACENSQTSGLSQTFYGTSDGFLLQAEYRG